MKVQKSNSASSEKKITKSQNIFIKGLINNYYKNEDSLFNNIIDKRILLNNNTKNNNIIVDSDIINEKNSFKYLLKNNITNNINKQKLNFPNSFSAKNRVIILKKDKLRGQIISPDNKQNNNTINFNKISYPITKWKINNNKDEEPFSFNDKYISNSFMINQEYKTKKNKNNGFNETSSKLLAKDLPSSLNNTQRYNISKFDNEEVNKKAFPDYGEDFLTFRNKEYLFSQTLKAGKISGIKKFNKANLRNNQNNINNIFKYEDNDINYNTYKNINSKFKDNNINKEIIPNENNKKLKNVLKVGKKTFRNLLFNNKIKDYKNNNDIDKKLSKSTDNNWEKLDNIFFDKSRQTSEIESCIISFRNSKINFKEETNSKNHEFNRRKYIKKNILNKSNLNENILNRKNIIYNETYKKRDYTYYKTYKKPTLASSQTIKVNIKQDNDEYNPMSYSHFNIYNKTENNKNEEIFYQRQYLGNIFLKNKSKINSKNNIIFRKKKINSLIKSANNISKKLNPNNSPIYTKKCSSILRQNKKIKMSENNSEKNFLSNTQSLIKNNRIYCKTNISKSYNTINPTFKLFNSQIINIGNNIFNNNTNLPKNEYYNNTPFGEEITTNRNDFKKEIIINNLINSNNKNEHQNKIYFCNKYLINIEKIMKKCILPLSYYTKTNIKIFKMPIISGYFCSKLSRINYKNKKRKNNGKEISKNSQEIKIEKLNNSKNLINKKKLLINRHNIIQKKNYNNDSNIKFVKENNIKEDKKLLKLKIVRKKVKPKIFKNMDNIKKIKFNEIEIDEFNNNPTIINLDKSEILNIPKILKSSKQSNTIELKTNFNNKNTTKKELSISNKKKNNDSSFHRRSSSQNMKNTLIKKNKINNKLKIKMPNSEARKKKYKINIVKRVKVRFKKHFSNFSEEKILINNCNNDINEEQNIIRKHKSSKKNKKLIEKEKKIVTIIKEDLESYILFSLKINENKNMMALKNYNFSIIEQLLIKQKIDLSNLIRFYLSISFDIIDSKDKIFICNDYINNIIEKYKRTYLNKNNFIQIHEDILEILIDIINESNEKDENKYKFDISGALFYSLLINELFFVSDLNMFNNCDKQIYINIAKIIRYIIIYSNDDKFKSKYFEIFKNSKIFFNNPIYFKYVTKYLKLLNAKII